jgi:protein TonB
MQTTSTPTPAPVAAPAPPAPVSVPGTRAVLDPKHLVDPDDYYPDSSKRANEEGRCIARITIGTDGRTSNPEIATSAGFPRLDEACLKIAKMLRFIPATENGKPVVSTTTVPVLFKFKK